MQPRARSFAHYALLLTATVVMITVAACGRSDLADYEQLDGGPTFDGGPLPDGSGPDVSRNDSGDAASRCSRATCPNGCCDATGACQPGTALAACGTLGEACNNCTSLGFQTCDPTLHACENVTPSCGPGTCSGCCEGNSCLAGGDPNECGLNGIACEHCAAEGESCINGECQQPPLCGPGNCNGCCFGDQCLGGTQGTACGNAGESCQNCVANNETCQPFGGGGQCSGGPPPPCGPGNCNGCCAGDACSSGNQTTSCGAGGNSCQDCSQFGEVCVNGSCQTQCNPSNCGGCCDAFGNCQPGFQDGSCGEFGQQCQNCSAFGEVCQGGFCQSSCNSSNCQGCCDPFGNCQQGTNNGQCGEFGQQCQNCSVFGEVCSFGFCQPQCNPQTCQGCCDQNGNCQPGNTNAACGTFAQQCQDCSSFQAFCQGGFCGPCQGCVDSSNNCEPGFLNTACGENGSTCVNCTTSGSTCDTSATPRACSNAIQCPATYPGCPAGTQTFPPPITPNACSTLELQSAAAACSGGAHTAGCNSFITFEEQSNFNCFICLNPFDFDFTELQGIYDCLAPFSSVQCNTDTGCASNCEAISCQQCDPSQTQTCDQKVLGSGGECSSFVTSATSDCSFANAPFCNPANAANFGAWLQSVGTVFCGPTIPDAGAD